MTCEEGGMAPLWELVSWAAGALALAAAVALFLQYRFSHMHRLARKIPGPRYTLPLLGDIFAVGFSYRTQYLNMIKVWRDCGPVFRGWLGPLLVTALADPRDVEIILSNVKYIEKRFPYNYLHPWLGTGLLTAGGEKWRKRRKIITPSFHFQILDNFVPVFESQGNQLIENLKEMVDKGPTDLMPLMELYTQDVICETAMGVHLDAQKKEKASVEYVKAVTLQNSLFMQRIMRPWCFFEAIWKCTALGRSEERNLEILHGTTRHVIQQRKQMSKQMVQEIKTRVDDGFNLKKRLAFLDLLLLTSEDGHTLSDEDLREEVDTFMFEGHDTTASGIAFTLYEIARNEDVQERIVQELQEVMGEEQKLDLRMENLQKLKYLERVVKEGLRLWPPVANIGRDIREDTPLATRDIVLPGGCTLIIPLYALHRHPEFFPNPEKFDPDNFLPERCVGRHPYAYIPFSAGPRNCIGQKFAMLELKSAISKVIWHFKLLPVADYEISITAGLTLKSSNGVKVMLTHRERSPSMGIFQNNQECH